MDVVMRTNDAGTTWREPLLTTRVPATSSVVAAVPETVTREQTVPQEIVDFDGVVRTVTLPIREGVGQWRATVEGGRRLYVFARTDGSRAVVCLD